MASGETQLYLHGADKDPETVTSLIQSLRALQDSNPKAVRSSVHVYPTAVYAPNSHAESSETGRLRDRRITSWKMTEYMYFKRNNIFPTLARGLFTEAVSDSDVIPPLAGKLSGDDKVASDRIVARGYDKFFNIDETPWTSWSAMKANTLPPYYLTLKSNGCLILISALSPSHLLVASKHSLGTTIEEGLANQSTTAYSEPKLGTENDITKTRVNENETSFLTGKDDDLILDVNDLNLDEPRHTTNRQPIEVEEQINQRNRLTRDIDRDARSHADFGREWLMRTLKTSGRQPEELARRLWEENLTAVLELCDDSFEEHVIATPEYWTGLHLHGLNYNTPRFATKSPSDVRQFAEDFGFIQTKYLELSSLEEVKQYTDAVASRGTWEGDTIEGFVVRCTVRDVDDSVNDRPPYRPGAPFFFKIKFEEPYLLYRQWREVTRVLLPLLSAPNPEEEGSALTAARSKARRPEVGLYAEWCQATMKSEPDLFLNFERGVVRVRERFLAWTDGDGKSQWEAAKAGQWKPAAKPEQVKKIKDIDRTNLPRKWILIPVAVPGSGKTTIGCALKSLFGFGHTQSDDVLSRKTAPTFKKNILGLFEDHDVVYADRNNHVQQHFQELTHLHEDKGLRKAAERFNIRPIAIVWDINTLPYHRVIRICSERILQRGANHQTLRPDLSVDAEHEAVLAKFIHNFTLPDHSIFDAVVEVDTEDNLRTTLKKIVDRLVTIIPLDVPSEENIEKALEAAMDYKVTTPFHASQKVGKPVRYFGLAPELDLNQVVDTALNSSMSLVMRESARQFVTALRKNGRIAQKPHITLVHEKNVQDEKQYISSINDPSSHPQPHTTTWAECNELASSRIAQMFDFDLTHLVWDDRVMALVVRNIRPQNIQPSGNDIDHVNINKSLLLPIEIQSRLHITVGTQRDEISAFESTGILRKAQIDMVNGGVAGCVEEVTEGSGVVNWVKIDEITGEGKVRGMY